jgi:outer membrane protein TolC
MPLFLVSWRYDEQIAFFTNIQFRGYESLFFRIHDRKTKEVEALTQSIDISNDLFKSGRATYFEVLMIQNRSLQSKLELVNTKKQQYNATVNIYKALGGGWK